MSERRYYIASDNRLARPIGSPDGYTPEQFEQLRTMGVVQVHPRVFFHHGGQHNLAELARRETRPEIHLYFNVLHAPDFLQVAGGPWAFDEAVAELYQAALTDQVAWRSSKGADLYWMDPMEISPRTVVDFLHTWLAGGFVHPDAIFLDHLIERPFDVGLGRALTADEFPIAAFQTWQRAFVANLASDRDVYANGSWAIGDTSWDSDLTGIFWERLGDNWARYRYWPWKLWSWMTRRDVEHILDLRGASSFAVQSCELVHSVLPYTWLCRGRNEV